MKLSFKRALTDKCHASIGLGHVLNSAVLPFLTKGKRVPPGEPHKKTVYRFGPFQLDTSKATLARNGNQLKLQDLPCRLLVILVERPGEIVSREEVRQHLWPRTPSWSSITAWESRSGRSVMYSGTMRRPPAMWKRSRGEATGFWRPSQLKRKDRHFLRSERKNALPFHAGI
jgi:hypothetical protein